MLRIVIESEEPEEIAAWHAIGDAGSLKVVCKITATMQVGESFLQRAHDILAAIIAAEQRS